MAEPSMEMKTGWIAEDRLYTLQELRRRLGLGAWAVRRAKERGLKVLKIGRRHYVRGIDLIEYAVRMNEESKRKNPG